MTSMKTGAIRTRQGLALSFAEQGDPRGLPLILLHGYGDSWRSFAPLMARLPDRYRTVALTLRGHGDSAKPASGYGVRDFSGDVTDALDALGVDRAVVLGHSMGSLVAQRVAMDAPGRVLGLVLVGAFRTVAGNAVCEELWRGDIRHLADPVDSAFVRLFQEGMFERPAPRPFLETLIAESLKAPAHVWRDAFSAMLREDSSAGLARVLAPTLILWGDRDGIGGGAEQRALRDAIRYSRLITHADLGHCPHWDDPARAAGDIARFVDGLVMPLARAA